MNILVLNVILFTADNYVIPQVKTIKDTMIYGMCMGFKSLGHDVTLAAADEYRPQEQEDYDFDVQFFPSRYTRVLLPAVLPYSPALRKWLKRNHERYDLVVTSEAFAFPTLFAARICPEKTIIWHEMNKHQKKFHRLPSRLWHNIVIPLFMRKILAVAPRSVQARDFIRQYMPQATVDTIVEHGIDVDKFVCNEHKKRQVISSSQLIRRKNVDSIIRHFADLHRTKGYEDIRLLIAGRGEEEDNLKALTAQLGLKDCVDFLGFLPQKVLNEHIRNSLCFLINTRQDLNVISIPESIASGTPILTNSVPASIYYIRKHGLGIVQDNWGAKEICAIIDDNPRYVRNCVDYRHCLTSRHSAQLLLDIFAEQSKARR